MSSFTCISCHVAFKDAEAHKSHFKSDWHRYNLKRKVASLPPVSVEEFARRVLQQKAADNFEEQPVYCKFCRKSFANQKSYDNHLNSKKHKENEKNFIDKPPPDNDNSAQKQEAEDQAMVIDEEVFDDDDDEEEIEEVDSDEWDEENPIDNNDCLFCGHHSRSLVVNLRHMTEKHSFFIPDIEFCIDIKALLKYLGEKICEGLICLWCNEKGKAFFSVDAVRKHMIDKGHCKMLYEGLALAEYTDFYDYSSSYPDAGDENIDVDEEISLPEVENETSEYQLVLPSGAVIGHRSLMRYYKQHLNPNRQIVVAKNSKKLHKVLSQYKSLGWKASNMEAVAKTARDIHYMKRAQAKLNMKLGCKNNKLQTHFRQQVNF